MIEQEKEPHLCYSCDEEFVVHTPYETTASVTFCPFCGSEVEDDDSLLFDGEALDEDDIDPVEF